MSDPAPDRTFPHRHSGHCESGTISGLLRDRQFDLSEPMWFGLGSGLFFLHTPWIRVGGLPLTSYRGAPLSIVRNACRELGIHMRYERFRDPEMAQTRLRTLLSAGVSVGLQTCVYWLPYFPAAMRFQFNGHNLIAFAHTDQGFWLSDPVFENVVHCPEAALQRARFARGPFAPRGLLYYPDRVPAQPDIPRAVGNALRRTCHHMLDIPLLPVGVRGMRRLAASLPAWPRRLGPKQAQSQVTQIVRMQEEIGTGGGGFRFLFAAFLREAAGITRRPLLARLSEDMTAIGDHWRQFALLGAHVSKGLRADAAAYTELGHRLRALADQEEAVFRTLQRERR
ncbi:MAG TPA: BtrH N-terminal domain-containing protein [Acidiferrobacteraceae bacterium]|nr:BtrH N-terminal domain-containing protein [Acidiferrobacteraceae bacterium]